MAVFLVDRWMDMVLVMKVGVCLSWYLSGCLFKLHPVFICVVLPHHKLHKERVISAFKRFILTLQSRNSICCSC